MRPSLEKETVKKAPGPLCGRGLIPYKIGRMQCMEVTVRTKEELQKEAENFVARLSPKTDGATVVALSGELGAGKTTFVQGMARALGISDPITSPTFVVEKIYELSGRSFAHLVHIDAYRLKNAQELSSLGFETLLSDTQNLICVEWAENVRELIPEDATRVSLSVLQEGSRNISYA